MCGAPRADLARGVFSDEHDVEPRRPTALLHERVDALLERAAKLFRECFSVERAHVARDASLRASTRVATQKRMRDPWEKPAYAKSSRASEPVPCDPNASDQKVACFYYW